MIRKILIGLLAFGCIGVAFGGYIIYDYSQDVPEIGNVSDYRPKLGLSIYDRKGKLIHTFADEQRKLVSFDEIPNYVKYAFMAAEDANFYNHGGFDPMAIIRAGLRGLAAGKIRGGGSTLTQQLAKNLFLSPEKKIKRKIQELILARRLEQGLSKDEILFLYLNEIYFGRGAHGIEAAANNYFGKSVTEINVAEAAILGGLPQRPSGYAPHRNPSAARARQKYTLHQMLRNNFIDQATHDQALNRVVTIIDSPRSPSEAPYVSEMVRQWVVEKYGAESALRDGLQVWTTIDLEATKAAQDAIDFGTMEIERANHYDGPITTLSEPEATQYAATQYQELQERWTRDHRSVVATVPAEAVTRYNVDFPTTASLHEIAADYNLRVVVTEVHHNHGYIVVKIGDKLGVMPQAEMEISQHRGVASRNNRYERYPFVESIRNTFNVGDVICALTTTKPDNPSSDPRIRGDWRKVSRAIRKRKDIDFYASLCEFGQVQAALVSVEPRTGDILAIVGGRDFYASQYNRANQARRQIGSTFKPFIYGAAVDYGLTLTHTITDDRIRYEDLTNLTVWKPSNYGKNVAGEPISLLEGLTRSKNIITIKLANTIGIRRMQRAAEKFGLDENLPDDLSLALGSQSVTPLALTRAYAALADGGLRRDVNLVREVRTSAGEAIYASPNADRELTPWPYEDKLPEPSGIEKMFASRPNLPRELTNTPATPFRALTDTTAYIVTNMLQSVVERGTGYRARALDRPVAGKTGTTNDNIDSWFAGYVPQLSTVVWVGYDDNRPLGTIMTGSRAAAPIWVDYNQTVLKDVPKLSFPIPEEIVFQDIEPRSGELADVTTDKKWNAAFLKGTEPTLEKAIEEKAKEEINQEVMGLFEDMR